MTAQAALINDTILGMKRALRREHDHSGPDEPITQPTNRGNKLRVNAKYVHEGALGFAHLQELYKEKVEHAGYTRYILQRNPQRYDSEGDELDDDDADSDADAAAAEENPFSEIALERLLCPLKHPSELPTHPSMAHPYRSKALRTMTLAIEEKLRKERALLWRARNLHRQFLGDACWMPCGKVETPEDRYIFEPRRANDGSTSSMSRQGHNRVASTYSHSSPRTKDQIHELSSARTSQKSLTAHQDEDQAGQAADTDIDMTDVTHSKARPNEESTEDDAKKPKTEDIDAMVDDLPQHSENAESEPWTNGVDTSNFQSETARGAPKDVVSKIESKRKVNGSKAMHEDRAISSADRENMNADQDNEEEMNNDSSPESPRRINTRAQANATNPQRENRASSESPSVFTEASETIPSAHPLFVVPDSVRPDPNFSLPPNEADETRRLLWSYIQKQDETVRGFEYMLESLFKACRMKDDVFEWCKAEGHVGEMSDGEDWYDREKWGLAEEEELKKGADEEDADNLVDEGRTTGKRGRGRR
ncbi:hypothetical protein Egran_01908 [Elaphomyces granulatus]|uniref:Transcriptional regulatory protein RXT2 N-terminal domain-containing protein n=1 Tax=Elaphomyces granulatus TaxID=519963 RepID=A0A232M1W0_9EURO|nr:hypothetical protein Egran_01908 [Elaphomyces granulatus]